MVRMRPLPAHQWTPPRAKVGLHHGGHLVLGVAVGLGGLKILSVIPVQGRGTLNWGPMSSHRNEDLSVGTWATGNSRGALAIR